MSDTAGQVISLTVETQLLDDIRPLVPLVDPRFPLVFIRRGQGIAGIGEALRLEFHGPSRMVDAAAAWQRVAAAATVVDPVGLPGTGLVALGAFAFSDTSESTSVLIVPSVVIGRRDGVSWITRINSSATLPPARPSGVDFRLSFAPGALTPEGYTAAVASAVERIRAHDLSKVVLARDLVGHLPENADLRLILADLSLGYPDCFTFAVDGLVGSSPETLISAHRGSITARVLAGSMARGVDALSDQEAAVALATSTKDNDEHEYALQSLLTTLRKHTRNVTTSELPFTLKLPNLWHLASDVEATLTDGSTSLDLISVLHPTAAVAGTPTPLAIALIDELEPFDRGRYAGPVGWVGADGDGEWAVALRCAEIAPDGTVTAFAGAGIVGDSDPEKELAETKMKFRPIVEAFS
ncbi:isochorismate synthase [Glaciihabitans sp. dw_435]|uniref:isochorismate synthase n=1 Tax=Glaciihabitans sp. dw_435 TaxID=2720081 RepID=UPI0027DE17C8|nr:isochorismate synthase [Glaciihabitans sp. dw_435]